MNKLTALALVLLAVGLIGACRRNPPPSPTASVTATPIPTNLPPAPTAPPLTAAPTEVPPTPVPPTVVPPTQPPIPTTTALVPSPVPTNAPPTSSSAATSPAVRPKAGVYVTRLRNDPPQPRNKENVTFFATFNNTTGKDANLNWCVQVYRPGESKSFGITRCDVKTIPPGVSEQATTGWEIAGIRECIPVQARAVVREENDARTPFLQPNGKDLWLAFTACP